MAARAPDPYQVLGVSSSVSDDELRTAYRKLVKLHHPDHNGGSADSASRFEEVQDAYARIRELRERGPSRRSASPPPRTTQSPPRTAADPAMETRLADIERQLREAQAARERARQAARETAAAGDERRPSEEELGYVNTDDSFSKILADARDELFDRVSDAREHPVGKRVADLIDEIDALASKLSGERRPRSGK
jgi:curved DNA-binding protein CbpA